MRLPADANVPTFTGVPDESNDLSQRALWRLFFPLAMSGIFFPLARPIANAALARTDTPTLALATASITMSITMPLISPLFGLRQVVTALAVDRDMLHRLARLTLVMGGGATVLLALVAIPPVFVFTAETLMGVPPEIAVLGPPVMLLMATAPLLSVGRGYYQGILVHYGKAAPIGFGALGYLVGVGVTVFVAALGFGMEGAMAAALAMLVGNALYVLIVWWPSRPVIAERIPARAAAFDEGRRSYSAILSLYVPLATSTMLTAVIEPAIQIAIARAPRAELSLAVYPVCVSIAWLSRTHLWNAGQVVIAKVRDEASYHALRRFMLLLAGVTTGGMLIIALPWTSDLVFGTLTGLSGEIKEFATLGYLLLVPVPLFQGGRSLYHGTLVSQGATSGVQTAAAARVATLLACLAGLGLYAGFMGLYLALTSILLSEIAECIVLHMYVRRLPMFTPAPIDAAPSHHTPGTRPGR